MAIWDQRDPKSIHVFKHSHEFDIAKQIWCENLMMNNPDLWKAYDKLEDKELAEMVEI